LLGIRVQNAQDSHAAAVESKAGIGEWLGGDGRAGAHLLLHGDDHGVA
jgi:hypothetical protein